MFQLELKCQRQSRGWTLTHVPAAENPTDRVHQPPLLKREIPVEDQSVFFPQIKGRSGCAK